jgi:hypothetical protein
MNAITKPPQYMIFMIKKISTKIEGKRYLTKLNIKSAFHYISLVEESHQVVIFTTLEDIGGSRLECHLVRAEH